MVLNARITFGINRSHRFKPVRTINSVEYLQMLSNANLLRICMFGAVATAGTGLCVQLLLQRRIRNSTCYKEAVQCLWDTNKAVDYLGKPITFGYVEPDTESEATSDSLCKFKVPLDGSNAKGTLYYEAVREDRWYLSKVQLELENIPGRKFLLKEKKRNGTLENNDI